MDHCPAFAAMVLVGTLQLEYAFALVAVLSITAIGFVLPLPKDHEAAAT